MNHQLLIVDRHRACPFCGGKPIFVNEYKRKPFDENGRIKWGEESITVRQYRCPDCFKIWSAKVEV